MLNKIFQVLLRTVLLYFFLTLIYISGINSSRSGYIEPRSISVIEGSNVTFQCNFNSSLCSRKCFDKLKCDRMDLNGGGGIIVDNICIHFGYNNKTTIAKEYITVINSSTVALNLINTQPMNEIIKCHCNDCTIDGSDIYVEKRLEPVNDFECSSYDFSYMNCSFSTSEYLECNFYSLYYMISTNLKNGSFESSTSIKCNLKYNNDEQKCFCKIEGSDYYQFYQYYIFNLNASSKVQQHIQEFRIKQIEIMKPQNPQFKLIEKTSNSLKLEWKYKNAKYFKNFNVSILFNVTYYPRLELNKVCGISSTNVTFDDSNIKYIIELKGLEYSYTNYTIEIIVQTKSENNAPTLESKQILLLETAARAPDIGPKVLPGSFYIDENNKKIRLYWQPLQKFQENGQNITYIIKEVFINDEQDFNWRPEHININSALYVGYEIKNKYEFHIYSKNEIGESKNYSSIFVSKRINIGKNYDPLFVAKIINRNIYEIIWTEPTNINELVNYSLFWCKTTEEMSPNVCENIKYNSINFKEVKKSENSYSFTIDNHNGILNLGISANYKNFSSGIIWAPCMADKNDDFPIVEILKYDSGKNFIKIFWNSQCKYEPLIENYDIKYCHGINNISNNIECESGTLNIIKINKNINLNSKSFKSYTIKNLQPYQKYLINIRMSSKLKTGPYLKYPLFIYTEEDAPSSPRNLKLLNLTDNSATIEWNSPKTSNGLIKSYEILLYDIIKNDNIKNITLKENQFKQINNSIQFKIIDLKSYNSYKVFIIAKTKYSSNLSNGLEFNTTVGYPGSLQRGNLKKNNEKKIITWNSPIDKGAETISYYQIIVTLEQLSYISIVQQKHCTLKYSCDEFQKNSEIKIYAVSINAIPKETFIRDNMTSFVIQQCEKSFTPENKNFLCEENISTEIFTEEYCNSKIFLSSNESLIYNYYDCSESSFSIIFLIIIIFITIVIFFIIFALCYFGVKKIKAMNDINLTYPSGLYDIQNIMKTEKQNQNWKHKTLASAFCKKLNLNGERFLTLKRHIKCIDDSQKSQNKFEDTLNTNKNSNFDLNKDVEKLLSEPSKENYIPMAPIISSEHCYNKSKTEIEMLPILNDTNGMDYEMKVFNKNLHENSNFNKNETEFNKKLKIENIEHNIQNKSECIINSPTETIIKYQKPENIGYVKPNTTNNVNMFLNRQLESLNQSSGMFPSGYVRFTNEKLLQNGYVHPNWKNFMQTMDLYKTIHRETSNYVHSNQFYDPLLNETNIIVPCPIYNLNQNASGYVYPIKRDFLQIPNKNLSFDQNPSAYIKSFGREFQQAQKHFLEIKNSNLFVDQCSETQKLNLLLDQNISDKQTSEYVLAENLCPYETITHLSEPNINQRMNKLIDSKQDKTKDTSTYLKPIKLKELELNNEKLLINSDEYKLGGSINCESPSNIFSGYVKANVQIV